MPSSRLTLYTDGHAPDVTQVDVFCATHGVSSVSPTLPEGEL